VEKIQAEQKQASAAAPDKPQDARRQESQITQELGEVPKDRTLPRPVNERLADAKEATGAAAARMDRPSPDRRDAARRAEQAIQRALSEIDAALADAKRQQLAQSIAELAAAGQSTDQAAQQLAQLADQQVQAARQAQEAVENVIAAQPESMEKRMERLTEAEEKVRQAATDQQRAAGRPEAAQAMDLAAGIRKALEKQDAADRAAETLGKRPEASPLDAVVKQQDVSQAAAELAKQAAGPGSGFRVQGSADRGQGSEANLPSGATGVSPVQPASTGKMPVPPPEPPVPSPQPLTPDLIAKELKRAEKSGHEAARDLLVAKPQEADSARAETRKALEAALHLADEQATHAAETPAGAPDTAAQARVGQEAAAAGELAKPDAPQAAQTLGEAGKTSEQAQQHLSAGAMPTLAVGMSNRAAPAQQATTHSLHQAAAQLAEAKAHLADEAARQMAAAAEAAARLADQAVPIDPGATAALQAAENRAEQGAEQGFHAAMEEAVADLGARQQQILQDRALALGATRPSDRSSPLVGPGGLARSGRRVQNQSGPEMSLQPTDRQPPGDARTADAANSGPESKDRETAEKPWMAELPPEVREALRVNSQQRPPRGYEEVLRRYFKNLD
jgi:hypothetical protein